MNKQGVAFRQMVLVFYLIMAVFVVLMLSLRAKDVVSAEERADAYSKNIALTINAMLYSDYNPEVEFIIASVYKIDILSDKVLVVVEDITKEYNYIPDNNFKIEMERTENKLILRKVKK